MRKIISVFILAILIISTFGINAQAVQRIEKGNVSYGTPTIDGVMDDCYKNSTELAIEYIASIANSAEEGIEHAKGKIQLCWDENYIYMYLDVVDKTPCLTGPFSPDNYSSDAFESTFDFDNLGDGSYGDNGLFVKVLAYAKTVGSPEMEIDWVLGIETEHQYWWAELPESEHQVASVIKSDGYIIERRVPLNDAVKAKLKPGYAFGFQIWLLDDIDDNNQRDFKLVWGKPTDDVDVTSWNSSDVCDELILIEAPPPPEPEPEPEAVDAVDTVDDTAMGGGDENVHATTPAPVSAPQTGDATVLFSLVSLIGVSGLASFKIKRRK